MIKILRKYITFFICLILGVLSCKSQSYIGKYMPEYLDVYITTKIIDSLRNSHKSTNFIIYQTNVNSKIVIDSTLLKNDTIAASYLIWQEKGKINSYIITDTLVYKNRYPLENNNEKIFRYPYFSQLWLQKDEDIFKIVPTINEPFDKDIVVYLTPGCRRFFEIGDNTYYLLNKKRNIYRKEYISQLKSIVSRFNYKWEKVFNNEKRWWGYSSPGLTSSVTR